MMNIIFNIIVRETRMLWGEDFIFHVTVGSDPENIMSPISEIIEAHERKV